MKIIQKNDIKNLLREANKEWNTYVPLVHDGGDVLFATLSKDDKVKDELERLDLDNQTTVVSSKEVFFPQLEKMMDFNLKEGKVQGTVDSSKKLIFGVKSCELKGVLFADDFFKRNFEDVYYLSRRQDNLIVVIGCNTPPRPDACFCTSAGTGPFSKQGFDLQLVDLGEYYLVEVGSDKGKAFVEKYNGFFNDPKGDEVKNAETVKSEAEGNIKVKVDFKGALEYFKDDNNIPEENYRRIADRCIECGACVYTCPTCTCYDVYDDSTNGSGVRCRIWDACVFSGYTREASKHNPRKEKWLRAARRYEHKLKYDTMVAGESGCIACGRCLDSCPVNIGMSKFIDEITKNEKIM